MISFEIETVYYFHGQQKQGYLKVPALHCPCPTHQKFNTPDNSAQVRNSFLLRTQIWSPGLFSKGSRQENPGGDEKLSYDNLQERQRGMWKMTS